METTTMFVIATLLVLHNLGGGDNKKFMLNVLYGLANLCVFSFRSGRFIAKTITNEINKK